jgi:DNA mismatch repair protein MutS
MSFITDKQTLDDLTILGKQGGTSVFERFNRCATRGGAVVLEEMLLHPLADGTAISRRIGTIRELAAVQTHFPFTVTGFDLAERYLSDTDERTRLAGRTGSASNRLANMVAKDTKQDDIYKGIRATVALLHECRRFLLQLQLPEGAFYKQDMEAINTILCDPALAGVMEFPDRVPATAMTALDTLLRFRNRRQVYDLLQHLYRLDVYIAVGRVAAAQGYCFPTLLPPGNHQLQLQDVYHPNVQQAVPNSLEIDADGNVIFLTGANMAGKSTFMKSVSIAVYLAHAGMPVPAAAMAFSVFNGMYTTINLPDNLGMGASHFYAEVLRVKLVAKELAAGKRLFVVFDELFRGTNVKDAYEASVGVTKGFARKAGSVFIISTHIIEAADVLAAACSNIRFLYLPTHMNGNTPVYTYRVEEGVTADRHGMVIIQNEGILDILHNGVANKTDN